MSCLLAGLGVGGKLMVIGLGPDPIQADTGLLVPLRRSIEGCYSGTSIDSEDTLAFSHREGVASMNEVFPLELAAEAYEKTRTDPNERLG